MNIGWYIGIGIVAQALVAIVVALARRRRADRFDAAYINTLAQHAYKHTGEDPAARALAAERRRRADRIKLDALRVRLQPKPAAEKEPGYILRRDKW